MPLVHLVDDDPAVLRALSRILAKEGLEVQSYPSAEAFLSRADALAPGCLVLDLAMPGVDGLDLQGCLAADGNAMPVVFLTGNGSVPLSVRAMKAGAVDFLTKPVPANVLIDAVRAALEQDTLARERRAQDAELWRRLASLTPREREVLEALAAGKLNKQIAIDLGIVEQTVKFHRARIMERMQARTVAELMHMSARLSVNPARGVPPGHPSGADLPGRG